MKKLYAAAIALGILGVALIGTATAQAVSCANARVLVAGSYYSIQLSVPNESLSSTKTYERLESGVPVSTVNTTAKSYTWTNSTGPALTVDTTFRVTSPGCAAEYNPPEGPGYFYFNGPI